MKKKSSKKLHSEFTKNLQKYLTFTHTNIKKNNMFKKDFTYPLFSRVKKISNTTFPYILKWRTFLFSKKLLIKLILKEANGD